MVCPNRQREADRVTIECEETFVCWLMFPSLLEGIMGRELPIGCSKLTCAVNVKVGMYPGNEINSDSGQMW